MCARFIYLFRLILTRISVTLISVKTEAPPAGDFGRRSGRSFGRGSSGRNSEYPVLTGPPVLARAPAISRSFDQIRSLFHQLALIFYLDKLKFLISLSDIWLNLQNELSIKCSLDKYSSHPLGINQRLRQQQGPPV